MATAFQLEVGQDRLATLTFDLPGKKVNIFNQAVLAELASLITELAQRRDIGCLILLSGKPGCFIAGADVEEIAGVTDPNQALAGIRAGQELFSAWGQLPFPTVAAVDGLCLGGGVEIALASTFRLVSDGSASRFGLPEVKLGIVPAWGGCTRLPRLVGLPGALDVLLTGKNIYPKKALKIGLVDGLIPQATFLHQVREFASRHLDSKKRPSERTDFKELLLERNPLGRKLVFDQARKKTLEQSEGHYPAPLRIIEVVRIGIEDGVQAGLEAEQRAASELAVGAVSKNLIHVFQLMEGVKKAENRPPGTPHPVTRAAVLGAGVMGGGIAQLIADKMGISVRLKDIGTEALASGMQHASSLFARQVKKRRLRPDQAARKMALIQPTLTYDGFDRCDLLIEAIIENLGIKQKVFAEVEKEMAAGAVLASNTSSLSIDLIGNEATQRGQVVGMHFFNPVDRMPLVEVIAGEASDPDAVRTVYDLALKLGKTPVVVRDAPGFLVNRLLMFYSSEALWLLDEGYSIEDVDRAMKDWGMPLGPLALTDDVGIDVAVKVAHILGEAFGDRMPTPEWLDKAGEPGRLGSKTGLGFYRYDGHKRTEPDREIYRILGLTPRVQDPDPAQIAERLVLPMVNEAARCLSEGVVRDPASLDLAMIMGTGFPPFRGGLCRWADAQGLSPLVDLLEEFAESIGPRFKPCDSLRAAAESGGFYSHRWPAM